VSRSFEVVPARDMTLVAAINLSSLSMAGDPTILYKTNLAKLTRGCPWVTRIVD